MATINITGTGGIIEGNLGTANVNVNLDSSLSFDGSDDNINIGDITVLDGDGSFTQTAWAKFASDGGGNQYIAWKDDAFGIALFSNFRIRGYIYYSGGNTNTQFEFPDTTNGPKGDGWIHIASSYDGSNLKLYVNGDLKDTVSLASKTIDNSTKDFKIGGIGSGTQFKGEIADVRLYSSTLTDAEIKTLASKINIANEVVQSTSTLVGWWKLNNNSITDSSTNSNNGTATGTTQVYDDYSVDVYDNSTTTDGTFTVTQGKVEGLALTSLAFDGTDDHVDCNDVDAGTSNLSIAGWFKLSSSNMGGSTGTLIAKGDNSGNRVWTVFYSAGNGVRFALSDSGSAFNDEVTSSGAITDTNWHHFVATYEPSTAIKIYIDGVLEGTNSSGISSSLRDTNDDLRIGQNSDGAVQFNGQLRDMRIYDYTKSAEQVASLYSNTYPQTPKHYWKLDDSIQGVTTDTAIDSGTGTAANGTLGGIGGSGKRGEAGASSGWQNGTLDLDGTLTIAANGTLSAPRGNLDLANIAFAKNASGTFTHNNGNVKFSTAGGSSITTSDPVLYDLEVNQGGSNLDLTTNLTIEHNLTVTSGMLRPQPDTKGSELTITFGTTSYASQLELDNYGIGFESGGNNTHACALVGASSLYPFKVLSSSSAGIDLDSGGSSSKVKLANIDYDKDITSGGGGVTVTLTGDAEFNAFTVSSGDTLDLNGQRAEFGGLFKNSGTIDCDGALIHCNQVNIDGTTQNTSTAAIINNTAGFNDFSNGQWKWMGTNLGTGSATESGSFSNTAAKRVCMSGTIAPNDNTTVGDMVIATGATYNAGSHETNVAGDFTTSGGLVGASCLSLDSSNTEYAEVADHADLDFPFNNNKITLECWFKTSTTDAHQYLFDRRNGQDVFYMYIDEGGNHVRGRIFTTGTTSELRGTSTVNDGKWHHAALVYDGAHSGSTTTAAHKLYIDGKLEDEELASGAIYSGTIPLRFGARYSNEFFFNGEIDEMRVFAAAKTDAQIREDMFNDVGTSLTHFNTLATSSSTGLVGRWGANEGTGSALSCSNSNLNGVIYDYNGGSPSAITDAWAGAGTFTHGTSTLVMSGSNKFINYNGGVEDIYNLNITGTITLKDLDGGGSSFRLNGDTFTCGSGATLSSNTNEPLRFLNTMDGGTVTFADPATNVANLFKILNSMTSPRSVNIPEVTIPRIQCSGSSTTVATGNHTITTELEVNSGTTFNANGNTITALTVDVNGNNGTLDLRNSTLKSFASGGDEFHIEQESTLLTGNTIISGFSAAEKTGFVLQTGSTTSREVVGTLENVIVDGDVTVIGSVINCDFANTSSNIRQFHHTLDTQQLLDADEAGDDDLKLEKPALDNAVELQTG